MFFVSGTVSSMSSFFVFDFFLMRVAKLRNEKGKFYTGYDKILMLNPPLMALDYFFHLFALVFVKCWNLHN